MRGAGREAGFMLVETLAGLAILTSVLIATYAALSGALAAAHRLAERRAAVAEVQHGLDALRLQQRLRAQVLAGALQGYRWSVAVSVLQRPPAGGLIAYRVVGRITRNSPAAQGETVLDTVLLGPRP